MAEGQVFGMTIVRFQEELIMAIMEMLLITSITNINKISI